LAIHSQQVGKETMPADEEETHNALQTNQQDAKHTKEALARKKNLGQNHSNGETAPHGPNQKDLSQPLLKMKKSLPKTDQPSPL
jgi:hypothetical protein